MKHYQDLCGLAREWATLGSVEALLGWDQETLMPPGGAAARAAQIELLASLTHERRTNPRVGELIAACEQDRQLLSDPVAAANIREMRRDHDLATKLPKQLVADIARTSSQAQEAWKGARAASDFSMFQPWLEKMVALVRQKAQCYGAPAGGELYDALLNEYEPGATAAQIQGIFEPLAKRLAALVQKLTTSGKAPSEAPLRVPVSADRQHEFGKHVLAAMGFDLSAGRLDVSAHPFCSGIAPGDTRMTTRYRGESWPDALYGTMHEGGHGLYEQGLPKVASNGADLFGTPAADSISLGIHESQSRMWENIVGRSREFWEWAYPLAKLLYAPALDAYSLDDVYRAVNIVRPSLIRVEADEATYNLHILMRFEMERAMLSGSLSVGDLPGAWRERVKQLLGIEVPDDRRGCLQDVHWSFGLYGYFPTYTLGNLYAAQMWETIRGAIPDLPSQIARGQMGQLRQWLLTNIHAHGKRYRAADLCQRVTGKPLSSEPLMRYLETKFSRVYGV